MHIGLWVDLPVIQYKAQDPAETAIVKLFLPQEEQKNNSWWGEPTTILIQPIPQRRLKAVWKYWPMGQIWPAKIFILAPEIPSHKKFLTNTLLKMLHFMRVSYELQEPINACRLLSDSDNPMLEYKKEEQGSEWLRITYCIVQLVNNSQQCLNVYS